MNTNDNSSGSGSGSGSSSSRQYLRRRRVVRPRPDDSDAVVGVNNRFSSQQQQHQQHQHQQQQQQKQKQQQQQKQFHYAIERKIWEENHYNGFPPIPMVKNSNGKPSANNITTIGNSTNGATTHPIVSGIQLLVSSIAVILCCITILAMTLPLLDKKKRKRLSTYNLYLVFLSIPDLVYNIFLIYLFSEYLFSEYDSGILNRADDTSSLPLIDHPIDLALFTTCATANLYTNAIISYEILKLLRDSKARRRSYPPTLKKATIQASFAYILGIIIFLIDFFAGDYLKTWPLWIIGPIYYGISVGIPVLYLLWVCFCIQYEKLLLSNSGKKMKVLVRYFGRIIIVYVCIWIPASILYSLQWSHASHPGLLYFLACFFYAIQVWVSFGLSLTKPDVRIAICYLLKFKYCRRCWYNYNKNKNKNGNKDHEDQVVEVILNGRRPRTTDRRRRQRDNNNSNKKNNNATSSGTISGVSAISDDDDDDDDDFDGGSRDTISNDCEINNILVKEEGNNVTTKRRHVSLASSLYAHSSSIHTLFGGGGSGGVSVSGAFNSSDGSFGSFSTGFNISEKESFPAFRRNSRDDYNEFLTVLEEECNLHGVNNDGNDNQRDMMNTNNNNDTNSITVIDSTNSNKDVGEEEDKEGIKEEEEIKDNSIHNDHHKGVNDANNSFSLSSGDIEEYTTPRPSSPTSTTPSSPTRNPLMRIINPLVGVFRSSSASSAGGDNNNSSLKDDDDDEGEDQDEDDSNGIVETPGNSDSPSSSSSNNTKNRMDLQQKIINLRHNVAELRQQLKYAVTDEEKDLFRQSIASQRHVLARMSSVSLDIDDSEDSLFGFLGDGTATATATGTDTDTYGNRYTMPNNNASSSSNNNTCSNNKNNNSNKRVDSCTNNAYQRSPLDVINDDSTCSKGDDGNYDDDDNDDTDINDSLSSIGLDNKVENKD